MSSIEPISTSSASSFADRSASDVRDAISTANERFMTAFRDGDAGAVAACYTADAQLLPANSDAIAGTQAIEGFWRGATGLGIADIRLETSEIEALGDTAIEVGRYTLAGADGGAIDNGKYLVVWHRDAGEWKLHRDIWTTSRPPVGA